MSERRKAAYFFCGAVPGILFASFRLKDLYDDPSLLVIVAPSVMYVVGVLLVLGGATTVSVRKFGVAAALMAVGGCQWTWEMVDYFRHFDDIRAAGRANAFGAFFRILFLMAILVAVNAVYRSVSALASNNRWSGP
jgi:hypothetical protein